MRHNTISHLTNVCCCVCISMITIPYDVLRMSPGVKRRRISLHQYGEVLLLSNVCPLKGLQDYNEQLSPGPSTCCLSMCKSIYSYKCKNKGEIPSREKYVYVKIPIPSNVLRMSPGVKRRRNSLHQYGEVLLLSSACPLKGL